MFIHANCTGAGSWCRHRSHRSEDSVVSGTCFPANGSQSAFAGARRCCATTSTGSAGGGGGEGGKGSGGRWGEGVTGDRKGGHTVVAPGVPTRSSRRPKGVDTRLQPRLCRCQRPPGPPPAPERTSEILTPPSGLPGPGGSPGGNPRATSPQSVPFHSRPPARPPRRRLPAPSVTSDRLLRVSFPEYASKQTGKHTLSCV